MSSGEADLGGGAGHAVSGTGLERVTSGWERTVRSEPRWRSVVIRKSGGTSTFSNSVFNASIYIGCHVD